MQIFQFISLLIKFFINSKEFIVICSVLLLAACEKEIKIDVPASEEQLVVEASVNQFSPTLNYVVISKTLDYFNPDLSYNTVRKATVYITEGTVQGADTLFNPANRYLFTELSDTFAPGVYFNALFTGKVEKPYLLEITTEDGKKVTGRTYIPKPVEFDSLHYWFTKSNSGNDTNAFFYLQWKDGPEQDNYRMAMRKSYDTLLYGWGIADRFYTFDDEVINNQERPFQVLNPFKYGDTVNVYMTRIGRKEYIFWDSFRNAANNGGPFATPVAVKSNITGAIGSFTGYGVTYRRIIFR